MFTFKIGAHWFLIVPQKRCSLSGCLRKNVMIQNARGLIGFAEISLADLDTLTSIQLDSLSFGVVGLSSADIVEVFNATESKLAGLPADAVIGSHYFSNTAQCMNNFMVAQRLTDEPELDTIIDFVLTLRMRPTPVRLRLLKSGTALRRYILIERRPG